MFIKLTPLFYRKFAFFLLYGKLIESAVFNRNPFFKKMVLVDKRGIK